MKQYECYELRLNGPEPADHARADVDGSFEMNGTVTVVKGFYAGTAYILCDIFRRRQVCADIV